MVDEIVHYCVTNMPGAVGLTSTYALRLANTGLPAACDADPSPTAAVKMFNGAITNLAVAETFGMECQPFQLWTVQAARGTRSLHASARVPGSRAVARSQNTVDV